MGKLLPLRRRDIETLRDLHSACTGHGSIDGFIYVTPMMLGATDASHHSRTLRKLVIRGLCDRKVRGGYTKACWRYCITTAGVALLRKLK